MDNLEKELAKVLEIGKRYSHCVCDGIIYVGNFKTKLINIKNLTGKLYLEGEVFEKYDITSGLCPDCYKSLGGKKNGK